MIKMRLGRKPALEIIYTAWPKARMTIPDMDGSADFYVGKELIAQYESPTHMLYYVPNHAHATTAVGKKLTVTIAAIKGNMSYTWYKVTNKMLKMELRGKLQEFRPGDVIGLRPSTNGKSTRMVRRDSLTVVMSPTQDQIRYILQRAVPLIGGAVDGAKIGHIVEPKIGVKARRISEELEMISFILEHGGPSSVTDLKIKNNKLTFKYNGRPFGVVSDPS
jgi:hypothetical protein